MFKPAQGEIFEISEAGLRLATNLDLPVDQGLQMTVFFNLINAPFERKVQIIHRQEGIPPTYGASFIDKLSQAEVLRFDRAVRIMEREYEFGIYLPVVPQYLKTEAPEPPDEDKKEPAPEQE